MKLTQEQLAALIAQVFANLIAAGKDPAAISTEDILSELTIALDAAGAAPAPGSDPLAGVGGEGEGNKAGEPAGGGEGEGDGGAVSLEQGQKLPGGRPGRDGHHEI